MIATEIDELITKARELLSMDNEPLMPGFGMLVDKTFVKAMTDALEAAQKEIERLNKFCNEWCSGEDHYQEALSMLDCARCALKEEIARAEKAEAKNRWIPVSERLPKASEYRNGERYKSMDSNELVPFLVCCEDTELPFRAFYDGRNWGDGWSKLDVICWMPLPEPPKGAQDE